MKLQICRVISINGRGHWIDAIQFDVERSPEVEDAAAALSRAAGGLPMRMVDDDGGLRPLNANGVFRSGGL